MYLSRVPCFGSICQYSFLLSFHALQESPGIVVRRTTHMSSPTALCSRETLCRGKMSMSWHCCGSFCLNNEIIDVLAFILFCLEYFDCCDGEVKGDFLFVFFCFFSSCAWTVAASGVFHIFSFNFVIIAMDDRMVLRSLWLTPASPRFWNPFFIMMSQN